MKHSRILTDKSLVPIGGVAALAVFFFFNLPAAARPPQVPWKEKLLHLDLGGVALAMAAIISFILALQHAGSTRPWNSGYVIGLLVGFCLITIALVIWELWLGPYAMMTPRLYKQRSLWASAPYQFFFMGSYIVLLYYLPIYFQSILGASPIRSGVDNLPLVVAAAIFALGGGAVVMQTGRAQQVMFGGSMLATVALGLIYSLDIGTSTSKWVGYQIFVGGTLAFAMMHGLSVVQAYVGPEDISAVTANLLCTYFSPLIFQYRPTELIYIELAVFQTIGGAISTSSGQAAFVNRLLATLPKMAPTVDPALVLATGASELRNVFSTDVLPGVLEAYMVGIKAAFAVGLAFCGTAFLLSFAVPMRKLPTHAPGGASVAMG
jgi:hypothetical protein